MAKVDFVLRFTKIPKGEQEKYTEILADYFNELTPHIEEKLEEISATNELETPLRFKSAKPVDMETKETVQKILDILQETADTLDKYQDQDQAEEPYSWEYGDPFTVTFTAEVANEELVDDIAGFNSVLGGTEAHVLKKS